MVANGEANLTTTITTEDDSLARLSSVWERDLMQSHCEGCKIEFNAVVRRHHCRYCGKIFCGDCTSRRALIPPSSIVLVPKGGKKAHFNNNGRAGNRTGFVPEEDPDRMLTYTSTGADTLLYGKGLEERYKLAREPLRVCDTCCAKLRGIQDELRASNSNAVRYNSIDPTDIRRLFNSPLAFTLGHEIRKAAYTLNNLLPLPRKSGLFLSSSDPTSLYKYGRYGSNNGSISECKDTCSTISPTLGDLDGVRIPARLLEQAKGIAVLTVCKGGFVVGGEFGTGLVVARLSADKWSAPSAIGTFGVSWGALAGAQISDHVFLLMTDAAVELMATKEGSIQLGGDVGVAVGPLGRSLEANIGATKSSGVGQPAIAPIYTYSLSKGLYAGISFDGKIITTRHRVNENFYGQEVHPHDLLSGEVPIPPAGKPLYDALKRCHVYATNGTIKGGINDVLDSCKGIKKPNMGPDIMYRDDEDYEDFANYGEWNLSSNTNNAQHLSYGESNVPTPRTSSGASSQNTFGRQQLPSEFSLDDSISSVSL